MAGNDEFQQRCRRRAHICRKVAVKINQTVKDIKQFCLIWRHYRVSGRGLGVVGKTASMSFTGRRAGAAIWQLLRMDTTGRVSYGKPRAVDTTSNGRRACAS